MTRPSAIMVAASLLLAVAAVTWALAQPESGLHPPSPAWWNGELHSKYAETRLRLAEARLAKAEHLNSHMPGQVSESDLCSLRARIDLLRHELAETRRQPHGYGIAAQQRAAQVAVTLAEQNLEAARAVNRRQAGAVQPLDMRLRELHLEIARLRADIWDDPVFLASPTDMLQMQIDQLADQLQDVLHDVENAPAIQRR